jgi:hypothetical protein
MRRSVDTPRSVDAHANRSKGDGDTATWLPPYKPCRCTYVARQIAVKGKYDLWVTAPQRDAMTRVVATCPTMALPGLGSASTVAKPPSNQLNRAPPIQPAPPAGGVSYRNCTAARAAVLPRLSAGNLATHARSTATETVSPANDPRLAGRSTVDPVSLSQPATERRSLCQVDAASARVRAPILRGTPEVPTARHLNALICRSLAAGCPEA